MADKRDYYEVLGVDRNADEATLKRAYRKLAKQYHPDTNPGNAEAEQKFKEATEAYGILSDPEKRQKYDQFGHAAFDPTAGASGGYGGFGGFGGQGGFGNFNGFDSFEFNGDMGDIFSEVFGDFFGGGSGTRSRRSQSAATRGANVKATVKISFLEAVFGCEKELELTLKDVCQSCSGTGARPGSMPEVCLQCNGSGQVVMTQQSMIGMIRNIQTCPTCKGTGKFIKDRCSECRGTGYSASRKTIQITIPAGIENGQSIRIREKGEPGTNGGPRGDLLVEVQVERHPIFQRDGSDIYSTAPMTFVQAALGGNIRISTVDGDIDYEIKPGTQTDTQIRLRGKGVPSLRGQGVRGDHYVTLVVQVPTRLSDEAKDALKEFDAACGNRPHKEKRKSFMEKIKESFED